MSKFKGLLFAISFLIILLTLPLKAFSNNLTVDNVRFGYRDPSAKTVAVLFDASWNNSWKNKINHDAIWFTVRLTDTSRLSEGQKLCRIAAVGLSPKGMTAGSNSNLELWVPDDAVGAFLRRNVNAEISSVSSQNISLSVDYSSCGFDENSNTTINISGFEMVLIPSGSFYAGDFARSEAALRQGISDNDPWEITSEGAINVSATNADGYYYVSSNGTSETATGSSFVIPEAFPKGYNAYYSMKYEINEGDWINFVNSLPYASRLKRDITNNDHKGSDAVIARNTVSCSGTPLMCTTERPFRAMSFMSWQDFAAFIDWAGMRPMTELEYEKNARGPYVPLAGEYAWGTTGINAAQAIESDPEEGAELSITSGSNAHYGNTTLTGGDSVFGAEYQKGPLRIGIFSKPTSSRSLSGAGYFGTMELSGNLKEWVVSVGSPMGLMFSGLHGDGYLTTLGSFEGSANVQGWVGLDSDPAKGITNSLGAGLRGGSWLDQASLLRISDRSEATLGSNDSQSTYGGRGVRSAE